MIRKEGEETSTQGIVTIQRNANEDGKEKSVEAARKAELRSRCGTAELEKKRESKEYRFYCRGTRKI